MGDAEFDPRRLAANVCVGGVWYGPSRGNADRVPVSVAAKIRSRGAWERDPVDAAFDAVIDRLRKLAPKDAPEPPAHVLETARAEWRALTDEERADASALSDEDLLARIGPPDGGTPDVLSSPYPVNGNVEEVLAWVYQPDPASDIHRWEERAREALDREHDRDHPRKGVTEPLGKDLGHGTEPG